jgi:hypothetical protein
MMSRNTLQSKNDEQSGMKSVRWHRTCTLRYYVRSDQNEISKAWFCAEDYKGFQQHSKIVSGLGKEIGAEAVELYCKDSCRGLEHVIDEKILTLRRRRRELAWDAVLEQQQLQRETDDRCSDTDKVAIVYGLISDEALADAHTRALNDAKEADSFSTSSTSILDAIVESKKGPCQEKTKTEPACSPLKPRNNNGHGALGASAQSVPSVIPRRNWQVQS